MVWCNDPQNNRYNSLIKLKKGVRSEKMFRRDNKYDLVLILDYNLKKPIPFKGSAIFIHITKDYKKTAGCVTLKEKDLLILLKLIKKNTKVKIY